VGASGAAEAAEAAARQAGVVIRILADAADTCEADRLLAEIWAPAGPESPVSSHLMRALAHSGNYVAGAWAGPELVGASVAFFALEGGTITLHSHITGVDRRFRGAHVGLALKLHQRRWALERGITEIGWSFDPLVRRNAWFNLTKLGGVAVAYRENFYGPMADRINAGDESDRCLVRWTLTPCDASRPVDPDPLAAVLLDEDGRGYPVVSGSGDPQAAPVWLCRVPADIEQWRQAQPERARAWRLAVRRTLGRALGGGFIAARMTRDGCYVLTPRSEDVDA
jgi:predicted GNAT superfamily acetyltransferase